MDTGVRRLSHRTEHELVSVVQAGLVLPAVPHAGYRRPLQGVHNLDARGTAHAHFQSLRDCALRFFRGLLVTHSTHISWGDEISVSFQQPPYIYLEIFLLGLVVQALFSVTLVTLSAAATLYVMNLIFTHSTGLYFFVDTNIPAAVFLGLHLLVTDPATSPRKNLGKFVFGSMYGAGVFGLYWLLNWLGVPTFYDKLLVVPPLNLTVRALDRASVALATRVRKWKLPLFEWLSGWS